MRRILPVAVFLAMAALAPAAAFAGPGFDVGVRGSYWFPDLSGDAKTNGAADTRFDVKDTLGMENENFPVGEAFLRIGNVTLRVGYAALKFDGAKTLTDNVTFGGATYSVSDNVVSRLDMKMLDGDVQFDILRPDVGAASVNLGLILRVRYVDGEVELRSAAQGTTLKEFQAPVPMVGVAAGAGILSDLIRVDARVTGIAYSGNHLYDADAFASFAPFPFVRVQGGYRFLDLKIDKDDTLASFKLQGPYVGAQLSF